MKFVFAVGVLTASTLFLSAADNWPQFRGPTGDGQSSAKGLPLTWSDTEHVKWKTPIHDKGWSQPVIWGDQIWLTTATEENGRELFVLTLDAATGKVTRDVKLFEAQQPELWKKYNSYASPTPVIEEGRVYVSFGEAGTACLDTKTGAKLWERRDLRCNHYRGAGSSPILFNNLVILHFDGADAQFVVALDKATGKDVWNVKRSTDYRDLGPDGKPKAEGDLRKGYATPQLAMIEGKPVLLSNGAKAHYGYDPLTGKELWQVENQPFHSTGARPIYAHGLIFFSGGFSRGHFYAIKPPPASAWKPGNILDASKESDPAPDKPQLAWKLTKGVPETPSPVVLGELLFVMDNGGFASAIEAKTGKVVWSERVLKAVYASPILAEGRIYAFDREGKGVVLDAAREFKLLGEGKLDGSIEAAPAAVGKALYVRTAKALYRLEN